MEKYIKTNMGEMPIEDYLEITAIQHGFDSYEDMATQGFSVCINEKYVSSGDSR